MEVSDDDTTVAVTVPGTPIEYKPSKGFLAASNCCYSCLPRPFRAYWDALYSYEQAKGYGSLQRYDYWSNPLTFVVLVLSLASSLYVLLYTIITVPSSWVSSSVLLWGVSTYFETWTVVENLDYSVFGILIATSHNSTELLIDLVIWLQSSHFVFVSGFFALLSMTIQLFVQMQHPDAKLRICRAIFIGTISHYPSIAVVIVKAISVYLSDGGNSYFLLVAAFIWHVAYELFSFKCDPPQIFLTVSNCLSVIFAAWFVQVHTLNVWTLQVGQ